MAIIFDVDSLLCNESVDDISFDDDDNGVGYSMNVDHHYQQPLQINNNNSHLFLYEFIDEAFAFMLEKESQFFPQNNYLERFRYGELKLSVRNEAIDWISKVHSYHCFTPLTFCLAVNYLDRFLSIREVPSIQVWPVQLLAVACLSIAAKIEETSVPPIQYLQRIGDPNYVFEAKTIQSIELMVMKALNWKMNAITPCCFLDYYFKILCDAHNGNIKNLSSSTNVVNGSIQLILCLIRGVDFLEFRPSEIAAAVTVHIISEIHALDIDKASSCFIHLDKVRVVKCLEMIKGNIMIYNWGIGNRMVYPQKP